ncbi:hypothetical protein ACL02O_31075 [Micromonospora sp. MS34]|uniref:hypothetical protein n=1 Tax=Micromonospora sp. MS34 TaxID=3385971 RepID=UPI0039A1B0D6
MGLITDRLARWAVRRPHLLVAAVPGATAAWLAVEAEAARLGGVLVRDPADADLLVVAGAPGAELARAVERVWAQLPVPRARVEVVEPDRVHLALRAGRRRLASAGPGDETARTGDHGGGQDDVGGHGDGGGQGGGRGGERGDGGGRGGHGADGGGRGGHGAGGGGHGGDGDEGEQGGHAAHGAGGGHDGRGGGMAMPGGLMMAQRAEDRDGLTLDVLHLPLGPVLGDWPAGLVVELTVQGDLVQAATGRVLGPAGPVGEPYWAAGRGESRRRRHAAAHLDSLGRLWAVAGWPAGAAAARRLRDALLADVPLAVAYDGFRALDRRARRSRPLRWATDGLGVLSVRAAREAGIRGPAARAADEGGDVTARWCRWLDETARLLAGAEPRDGDGPRGDVVSGRPPSVPLLAVATRLMVGADVAAARLVLASFDPDPDELALAAGEGAG